MVTAKETIASPAPSPKNESHHSTGHASSSDRNGNTPVVPKKPSEDGYSWRKYGQKNVKRNEYVRSYYRCSYHNCQVKKQVEHAHDGRISDTTYFGEHDHPKPPNNLPITYPSVVSVKVQIADSRSLTVAEDKSSSALALIPEELEPKDINKLAIVVASNEGQHEAPPPLEDDANKIDKLVPKRRKKSVDDAEPRVDKPGNQSSHVVETVSVVDIVNDGYRWRKYGQKLVKGSQHPRSYYRCSNPGCPAKKHVERAFRDPKVVITTYEGKHDHDIPPVRTMFPHGSPPSLRPSSEPNGVKNSNKPDLSLALVAKDTATTSDKQQDDASHHVAEEKKDAPADPDVGDPIHDSSGPEIGSSEQRNPDNMALAISCQESDPKERQKSDSEPVSC